MFDTRNINNISFKDTISALATPTGGAIAVIRLSGSKAICITDSVFRSRSGKHLAESKAGTLHYGEIIGDDGETIDDVVVSIYHVPHSYTGEDCVEISCHGSAYIVQQILMLLQKHGTRQAEPGEYTRRAYLNGKMDLSQAEAVADLIASTNKAQHQMAISQLKGHFSDELNQLREKLLKLTSLLELELDFSDHEELEFADRTELQDLAKEIDKRILSLADSFRTGDALKRGIPVAIVGKTNVGKSTLLNALLHEERAIVSDIHGTTRDIIEDTTTINGVTFRFIDTAGLRHTDDRIEQIGIDRALSAIDRASVVLWVIDQEPTSAEIDAMLERTRDKHLVIVANKTDINNAAYETLNKEHSAATHNITTNNASSSDHNSELRVIRISAKTGTGIEELKECIYTSLSLPEISSSDVVVTNARHYSALMEAHNGLTIVLDGMADDLPADLLAEDLKAVLDNLASITGQQRITPQETLNNIFSHFCVGK